MGFPNRPDIATDPYLYAHKITQACKAETPPLESLDHKSRIAIATMLQNIAMDLLRLQYASTPNQSWTALALAIAGFVTLLFPKAISWVLILQLLIAFWLVGEEQKLRDLKRATTAAQARIDEMMMAIGNVPAQ